MATPDESLIPVQPPLGAPYYVVEREASVLPWVIVGAALLGLIILLLRRETPLAPTPVAGADLGRVPAAPHPQLMPPFDYAPLPAWAQVGRNVVVRSNGASIDARVMAYLPGDLVQVHVLRVEENWRPGVPRIYDVLILPVSEIVAPSRL